ncbi:MAG: hypothetical protein II881_05920 [Oscillospiraceae bacterium]|nr:hypothetical protein [Oscillospiraceae bacterium]
MDEFTPIDRMSWARESLFRLYTEVFTTTHFSSSVRLDVTNTVKMAKREGKKLVPAILYCFSREISKRDELRVAERNGVLGRWNIMHPVYPVLNDDGNFTFHTVCYTENYAEFYAAYIAEAERNRAARGAYADSAPENGFIISVMPYFDFESFGFSFKNAKGYYTPIVSVGKYRDENGRLTLPAAVTVNHAAADGYHIASLFDGVGRLLAEPERWMV